MSLHKVCLVKRHLFIPWEIVYFLFFVDFPVKMEIPKMIASNKTAKHIQPASTAVPCALKVS